MAEVLSGVFAVVLVIGCLHGFRLWVRDVVLSRLRPKVEPLPAAPAVDPADQWDSWRG